jgi:hypothetical protein
MGKKSTSDVRLSAAQVHVSFAEALAEGVKIQPRFVAEPRYARTGVGFMRSVGVTEIAKAKKLPARRKRS